MKIPEFAAVVGVVPRGLHPEEEVVVVDTAFDDLGVAAEWWGDAGDVVVVCCAAGPECGAGWAAEGDCAVVLGVCCAFVDYVFLVGVRCGG